MSDLDDRVAALEAQMETVRADRDAANAEFRRQLRTLAAQVKVARAEAALAEAQAEVDAQHPEED